MTVLATLFSEKDGIIDIAIWKIQGAGVNPYDENSFKALQINIP